MNELTIKEVFGVYPCISEGFLSMVDTDYVEVDALFVENGKEIRDFLLFTVEEWAKL